MRKVFIFAFLVLLFAAPAFSQNVRVDNVAFSSVQGFPFLGSATITICTAAGTGTPCTPTVAGLCSSISDTTCNLPATFTTDALGNFGFWIQPGSYSYTVTKAGFGGFGPKALTLPCQPASTCNVTGPMNLTNLTVSGTATVGNLSNIKIIDGVKYAQSAAGINQADTDLGSTGAPGEIWIPPGTVTATDAQISINDGHTLHVTGTLTIDAAGKGPILMGKYSKVLCDSTAGSTASNGTIVHGNTTSIPSMIRARIQDGSLETFYVERCQLSAGNASVTRGVIDVSGMNDRGNIKDNIIAFYAAGWGIYADNVLGPTGQFNLINNWIVANNAPSTGSCIYLHGNSGANLLYDITLRDNECQLQNNSGTNPAMLIDNTNAGGNNLVRDIFVDGMYFSSTPSGQYDISLVATTQNIVHPVLFHVVCAGNGVGAPTSNCINIGTNVQLMDIISLWNFSGNGSNTNTINDTSVTPTVTLTTPHVPMYTVTTATSYFRPNVQILNNANFTGLQVGLAGNTFVAPQINLLTGGGAASRSWGFTINNNNSGALEFMQSPDNVSAPATSIVSFLGSNIFPTTAAAVDLGITTRPFGNLWLGTAITNNFKFQPAATAAARVISMPDPLAATSLGLSYNATNPVYQSKRAVAGCTTAASIGGTCASDITVTWGTAFGDANYSVTCTGSTPTAVPAAPFVVSGTKLAATVHINYFAITAVAASYATIDCIAVHD